MLIAWSNEMIQILSLQRSQEERLYKLSHTKKKNETNVADISKMA